MENWMAIRQNNRLFNSLMFVVAITFMLVWLPLLRCLFDGTSYSWGQWYFGITLASQGLAADYLALILFFVLYLALFASFYWVKNRLVFYILLTWWWMHAFGNLLLDIFIHGDTMFHGDTLNVHISLSTLVLTLSALSLLLILLVIRKDRQLSEVSIAWSRPNRLKAWIILAPLALQAVLLASGEPHGITDQIGVILAITQALIFPVIFFPAKNLAPAG